MRSMKKEQSELPLLVESIWHDVSAFAIILLCYVFLFIFTACSSSIEVSPTKLPTDSQPGVTLTLHPTTYQPKTPSQTQDIQSTIKVNPSATGIIDSKTPTLFPSPSSTSIPIDTFTTAILRSGVSPQTYIEDECWYLERRWAGEGSPPGTIVVPIMFHSIYKDGRIVNDPKEISETEFRNFHTYARSLGFETITTEQLFNFLDHNAPIPSRSMIIIIDDRRPGTIQEHFIPVLDQYDWSVTSAYIADPDSLLWAWDLMDLLVETGRVEVQSHGYTGQLYIIESTSEEEIRTEIERSTIVIEERYGKKPIAFVWPGGNFTSRAVKIARQDGYQLGFTAYSRGPLMFNWIPLGEEERLIADPLMVLPRSWSNSASYNLEQAVEIATMARAYAEENYTMEADWYHTYCGRNLSSPLDEGAQPIP